MSEIRGRHLREVAGDENFRTEVARALQPLWYLREFMDDDSEEAKAFDGLRAIADEDDAAARSIPDPARVSGPNENGDA